MRGGAWDWSRTNIPGCCEKKKDTWQKVDTWQICVAAQRAATCPFEKIPSRAGVSMPKAGSQVGAGRRVGLVKDDIPILSVFLHFFLPVARKTSRRTYWNRLIRRLIRCNNKAVESSVESFVEAVESSVVILVVHTGITYYRTRTCRNSYNSCQTALTRTS